MSPPDAPPAIPSSAIPAGAPGGADGLDGYRRVIAALPGLLARDGVAIVELGVGQAADVTALAGGFSAETRADLAGIARALVLRRAPP